MSYVFFPVLAVVVNVCVRDSVLKVPLFPSALPYFVVRCCSIFNAALLNLQLVKDGD